MARLPSLVLLSLLLAGCAGRVPAVLTDPHRSAVATSGGPNRSASYVARVEGGVVVVDLGWWGAEGALEGALEEIGAAPEDVIAVFLTHSHRDHLGAWRTVAHAPFHMAAAEVELFRARGGWGSRPTRCRKIPMHLPNTSSPGAGATR